MYDQIYHMTPYPLKSQPFDSWCGADQVRGFVFDQRGLCVRHIRPRPDIAPDRP